MSPSPRIKPERLLADLASLRDIGKAGKGVCRVAYSDADLTARAWLCSRLAEAGLEPVLDDVGNVLGRFPAVETALLLGSHTDTVPTGGWLDGSLGVAYAMEIARALLEAPGERQIGVDVVSFADEEGTFTGLLGSRTFCGEIDAEERLRFRDRDGTRSLADALRPLAGRAPERLNPERHLAYLEAHIEQGPRLEAAGKSIGIVSAIVGIRDRRVTFRGRADHAGTTPMAMRSDAGQQLIWFANGLLERFQAIRGPETVWNLGNIVLRPGVHNVVPESAELFVEYRDQSAERLAALDRAVEELIGELDTSFLATVYATQPVAMAEQLRDAIRDAAEALGAGYENMPSGAGHDAAVLARYIPAGMLFVPSKAGRSHSPEEDTSTEDIVLGAEVMLGAVLRLLSDFQEHGNCDATT